MNKYILSAISAAAVCMGAAAVTPAKVGKTLPLWSEGYLDIHNVNTARGECTFCVLPDGTTMLIDAGEYPSTTPNQAPQRPNAETRSAQAMTDYISHFLPKGQKSLDYMLVTHFHVDHFGWDHEQFPDDPSVPFRPTGVSYIGQRIPVGTIVDRGYPDYKILNYLTNTASLDNYCDYVKWSMDKYDTRAERFDVGSNKQFALVHKPDAYPTLDIRNIAANGRVWTGVGDVERNYYLPDDEIPDDEHPGENSCSTVLRISYGKFDYFNGGDLPSTTRVYWHNIEEPVGMATGAVEAMKCNHHLNFDTMGEKLLRYLRPQVIVAHTLLAQQPDMGVMRRLFSKHTWPGKRDVFCTNLHDATKLSAFNTVPKLTDSNGHFVIRVSPGGDEFYVYKLVDTDWSYNVSAVYGPYQCR